MITQLLYAFLLSLLIGGLAYWRGSLSLSGVGGALLIGTVTFGFGGWLWGVLLALFFITSSLLSHFKESEKRTVAEKFDKGHRRDLGQVLANGGLGAILSLLSWLFPSPVWLPIFMGVVATVNGDTWATELGTLSKGRPRLITSGRSVETGTSGAISLLGTLVSWLGGVVVAVPAGLWSNQLTLSKAILIGGLAGLAGSLFDSLLGATLQQIYYCDHCQKETERKIHKCGQPTRPLRGLSWLNNDLVNLISSLVGGLAAGGLWLIL